mgnify:CR=1 FL=1
MTRIEAWLSHAVRRITAEPLGAHQAAVVRIGFSLTWLLFLLREYPHRHELYGPDGPWSWSMGRRLVEDNGAFTALLWSDSQVWFECVYALAVVSSVLLLLGWRTRTMTVLFMFGVLSVENRSIFMSDGGDNVIHLMAIYLVLTRCGVVWSLDARRARRARSATRAAAAAEAAVAEYPEDRDRTQVQDAGGRAEARDVVGPVLWSVLAVALLVVTVQGYTDATWLLVFWGLWATHGLWWYADRRAAGAGTPAPGGPPTAAARSGKGDLRLLLDVIANLVHNAGLVIIMAETCLIYATAGWYKIQGSRWQDGTAVYYPLHLDYFSPWPALSEKLGSHGLVVLALTYGTVMVQVAFPFALFNRRVKNVLLVAMIGEHIGIAVTLGLPFFSMAMIAADSVFAPTAFLLWLGTMTVRVRDAALRRVRPARAQRNEATTPPPPDGTPDQVGEPPRPAEQRAGDEVAQNKAGRPAPGASEPSGDATETAAPSAPVGTAESPS